MEPVIRSTRRNIHALLKQCKIAYEVTPFDEELYQDCINDAIRRGYPVEGRPSVRTYLRDGVMMAATSFAHLPDRSTQIWIALYTSCTIFVDEVADSFPALVPNIYLFNDRLTTNEPHGNGILDAYADILHRVSELYRPISSHLINTGTMNFVTANLLEYETKSMKILNTARRYPTYQRSLTGNAAPYAFMVFPREIPLNEYIQAIPDLMLFIDNANDVLSFYKEELVGETTNQVSTLAARTNKSKLETYNKLTNTTIDLYKRITNILEGFPEAREAFQQFVGGYIRFHTSVRRYRLEDLAL